MVDALTTAISAYHDGVDSFSAIEEAEWPAHSGEEAVTMKTYGGPLPAHDSNAESPPAGCAFTAQVLMASIVGLFIAGLWIWLCARAS